MNDTTRAFVNLAANNINNALTLLTAITLADDKEAAQEVNLVLREERLLYVANRLKAMALDEAVS